MPYSQRRKISAVRSRRLRTLAARQRRWRVCRSGKKVKPLYRRRSIKSLRRRGRRRIGGSPSSFEETAEAKEEAKAAAETEADHGQRRRQWEQQQQERIEREKKIERERIERERIERINREEQIGRERKDTEDTVDTEYTTEDFIKKFKEKFFSKDYIDTTPQVSKNVLKKLKDVNELQSLLKFLKIIMYSFAQNDSNDNNSNDIDVVVKLKPSDFIYSVQVKNSKDFMFDLLPEKYRHLIDSDYHSLSDAVKYRIFDTSKFVKDLINHWNAPAGSRRTIKSYPKSDPFLNMVPNWGDNENYTREQQKRQQERQEQYEINKLGKWGPNVTGSQQNNVQYMREQRQRKQQLAEQRIEKRQGNWGHGVIDYGVIDYE